MGAQMSQCSSFSTPKACRLTRQYRCQMGRFFLNVPIVESIRRAGCCSHRAPPLWTNRSAGRGREYVPLHRRREGGGQAVLMGDMAVAVAPPSASADVAIRVPHQLVDRPLRDLGTIGCGGEGHVGVHEHIMVLSGALEDFEDEGPGPPPPRRSAHGPACERDSPHSVDRGRRLGSAAIHAVSLSSPRARSSGSKKDIAAMYCPKTAPAWPVHPLSLHVPRVTACDIEA